MIIDKAFYNANTVRADGRNWHTKGAGSRSIAQHSTGVA
jgi:hypothetical protein